MNNGPEFQCGYDHSQASADRQGEYDNCLDESWLLTGGRGAHKSEVADGMSVLSSASVYAINRLNIFGMSSIPARAPGFSLSSGNSKAERGSLPILRFRPNPPPVPLHDFLANC